MSGQKALVSRLRIFLQFRLTAICLFHFVPFVFDRPAPQPSHSEPTDMQKNDFVKTFSHIITARLKSVTHTGT